MKKKKSIAFIVLTLLLFAIIAKVYYDTNYFKVNDIKLHSEKIAKNSELTILQLTDIHNKVFGDNNEKLINTIKEVNADLIVITGDLMDRRTEDLSDVFHLVDEITKVNSNVYFVSGNHEWENLYREELFNGLQERNVKLLDNLHMEVTADEVTVNIVGVGDYSTNHDNLELATTNLNKDLYTIILSHSPDMIEEYNHTSVDLTLSGHTHGGQVRFPFIGALVAPDQGFFPTLDKGLYELSDNQFLYIDSGLGTSMLPIRFLNQSQLSVITIHNN
ncbi:metallophosphoesterase [Aquibacillus rhizosphaerae]|uniref:Metallophosphoesterase n=1 Tax=Aquibacillus rhizosphaerae TaxID=3051431 RepID=A0ABT7L3J3_9BACI|nr:metallophosphoesterase [Aquibacillus sp. LR5S19]MDL4839750.1 metallophosphoesterase [Aquibacillus sp. LR5S19]